MGVRKIIGLLCCTSLGAVAVSGTALATGACARSRQGDTPSPSAEAAQPLLTSRASTSEGNTAMLSIKSPAFAPNGAIPPQYTCQGQDTSPPLAFDGVPPATQSLALIVDDPDAPDPAAPRRVWIHWVLFNLPSSTRELPEGVQALPAGAKSGKNDWNRTGYGGPCPPIGRHRYFFKLYALDTTLELGAPTKAELEKAMQGHVLASAELIGTYQKS
jgi:Raf kinase inhibitor-like YbhB/YbcL family protein